LQTPSSSTSDVEEPSSPSRFLFARHVAPSPRRKKRNNERAVDLEEAEQLSSGDGPSHDSQEARIVELADSSSEAERNRKASEGGSGDITEETNSVSGELEEVEFEGAGPRANGLLRRMYGVGRISDEEGVYEKDAESEGERVVVVESELDENGSEGSHQRQETRSRPRSASDATLKSQEYATKGDTESIKDKKRRERKEDDAEEAAQADDEGGKTRDRYAHLLLASTSELSR